MHRSSLVLALFLLLAAPARAADSVIVKFSPRASAGARERALDAAGAGEALGTVRGQKAKVLEADSPGDVAAALNRSRAVSYAEPNATLRVLGAPDDALFGSQPDLSLIDAAGGWTAADLGGFPASGGPLVAIVDSGIDAGHEDLRGKVAACASAQDGVVTDGSCADENDHGTHVAGTIGAIANNGVGIAGVAFASPLAICRAMGADGSGTLADVAGCIAWAHAKGAKVISMSLGGGPSETLRNAVTAAYNGGRRGGSLLVAAAGNDGNTSTEYPAGYSEVVSVAAVDDSGAHAGFSNVNPDVELAAPGVGVLSTKWGGGYVRFSGTSMATPHVAGVAALALQRHPTLSAGGLRKRLDRAVRDLGAPGRDAQYGFGLVDAAAAAAA